MKQADNESDSTEDYLYSILTNGSRNTVLMLRSIQAHH